LRDFSASWDLSRQGCGCGLLAVPMVEAILAAHQVPLLPLPMITETFYIAMYETERGGGELSVSSHCEVHKHSRRLIRRKKEKKRKI